MTHNPTATRRTDAEIFAEARHALDNRPAVPEGVHIHVHRGLVTITGTVQRPADRAAAAEAVHGIPGVQRIVNDIVVAQVPHPAGYEPPNPRE